MVFEENFLRLTVPVSFQKNEYLKQVNFLMIFPQSIRGSFPLRNNCLDDVFTLDDLKKHS